MRGCRQVKFAVVLAHSPLTRPASSCHSRKPIACSGQRASRQACLAHFAHDNRRLAREFAAIDLNAPAPTRIAVCRIEFDSNAIACNPFG